MPTKAKASPDDIMPPAAIRSLLKQVRADGGKEINCAIGLPEGDKTQGVILLDRIMGPKKLGKHLAKAGEDAGLAMDARSIRFGKATTAEHDDTVLLIKVNKEPAGDALHKGIKKRVKLAGFTDVVFSVDEQLDGEADGAEQGSAGLAPAAPSAAPPDQHALSQRLAHLVKRIQAEAGSDPARLAALGGLAKQANALLKTGSPNEAAARMDRLDAELGGPPPGPGQEAGMEAFRARLAGMLPGIKAALHQHAGAGAAGGTGLDALASEAGALAKAGNLAGASGLLDQIAARLGDGRPAAPKAGPFQVFVTNFDNTTLTFNLPDAQATTVAHLQKLIEDRTGISPEEQGLSTGLKRIGAQHALLPLSEYGTRNFSLNGRLKGGFGERAAIADAIMRGIRHGNVLGDIQDTNGGSKAKKDFCRRVTDPDTPEGFQYLNSIVNAAASRNLTGNRRRDKQRWLNENKHFIDAIAISAAQAGNCGDYTQIVYSNLLSETENQFVYQVVMNDPYDHQFVVTSPEDHGTDIRALVNDQNAMVADAWWNNKICKFSTFADGDNPYGKYVSSRELQIVAHQASSGERLDNAVAAFAKDEIENIYKANSRAIQAQADRIDKRATDLAEATKDFNAAAAELDRCRDVVDDLRQKIDAVRDDVRRADRRLDDPRYRRSDVEAELDVLLDRREDLRTALDAAYKKLDYVEEWKKDARSDLRKAKANLPSVFGAPDVPWDSNMDDTRNWRQLCRTIMLAHEKGGTGQLEKELDTFAEDQFIRFVLDRNSHASSVFESNQLTGRFRDACRRASPDGLERIRRRLTREQVDAHVGW